MYLFTTLNFSRNALNQRHFYWRVGLLKIFIFLGLTFQTVAASSAQEVTLSVKNVPLKEVYRLLRVQTGYDFLYANEDLEHVGKVSLDVQRADLKKVLDQLLDAEGLSYSIIGKNITIRKKVVVQATPASGKRY